MAPVSPVEAELASRILSRRSLLPFVQRVNTRYQAGWVHRDICRRLEKFSNDVAAGLSPRLMILMPPRSGKSELCSRSFPAWHMGRNPSHELIACSYNVSLAMTFSKKVKELLSDPVYHPVFDIRLDPNNQSAEEWALDRSIDRLHSGGYVAAGVGGGITGKGAHCVIPYCAINTSRGKIPASQLKVGDTVYGYSHETGHVVQTTVVAVSVTPRAKAAVRCGAAVITSDHPVFAGGKYRPAHAAQGMPGVWLAEGAVGTYVQELLFEAEGAGPGGADVRLLSDQIFPPAGGAPEVVESSWRERAYVLLQRVLHSLQEPASRALQHVARHMRRLWQAPRGERAEEVLFSHLLYGVPGHQSDHGQLRGGMVGDQVHDLSARQGLHAVRRPQISDGSSSRGPRPGEPGHEEPDAAVHAVPQEISCVHGTCAQDLAGLLHTADYVVDFQTGTGNFFAGGLLVHNCLLIDDPLKNAEEADSADTREKLMDWYGSTAYTRLAPGGGVLVVQTCWHDSDLAGQLQEAMKDPDADQFVVVKYPAIAESDEWLNPATDLIERVEHNSDVSLGADENGDDTQVQSDFLRASVRAMAQGLDPSTWELLRCKGEALHPERYDLAKLNQIKRTISPRFWSALYQQNPVPDDGAYFLKEHFRRAPIPHVTRANVYIAWDFAISEKKQNDYTVGTVILHDEDDILHVAEQVRFKSGDGLFICDAILRLSKKWYTPGQQLGFEDGQIYRAIESLLKKRMQEQRHYPSITVLKPITDKLARARPLQGRMQQGMVSFNNADDGWYDTCRLEMLRFPAGAHDDCCLVAGTMITLFDGAQMPIERVTVGEYVATPHGPRRVLASEMTNSAAEVTELTLANGITLTGTDNHPVWCPHRREFVALGDFDLSSLIEYHETVSISGEASWPESTQRQYPANVLSSTAGFIAGIRSRIANTCATTSRGLAASITSIFGLSTTGLSLTGATSTTRTTTRSTTTLTTSFACQSASTHSLTPSTATHQSSTSTWSVFGRSPRLGTLLQRAWLGMQRMAATLGQSASQKVSSASTAGAPLSPSSTAPSSAASHVATSSGCSTTQAITRKRKLGKKPVYNLTVADAHVYYANGILTHNCDSLSWATQMAIGRQAPRKITHKEPESWRKKLASSPRGSFMSA